MQPVKPMLASPLKKGNIVNYLDWSIEEKYDGHRIIVCVVHSVGVQAFARPRKDGRMIQRDLSANLMDALIAMPTGMYDGELIMPGAEFVSTDVTRTELKDELVLVLFDLLQLDDLSWRSQPYEMRRTALELIFSRVAPSPFVQLAKSFRLSQESDVATFVKKVWARNGEGAILKLRSSVYHSKRTIDWLKIKHVEHDTMMVVGWETSRGEVMNRGPFGIVKLRHEDGNETTVKTKNDEELEAFMARGRKSIAVNLPDPFAFWANPTNQKLHPDFGRTMVIEHYGRTRDGGFRGPVKWDRWENE